jgi:anti-sigma regulatory factor (Ser/Thr protein kinase)
VTDIGFEHTAVVYDEPATVAEDLTAVIGADLARGRAVMVCVSEPVSRELTARVPPHRRLHVLPTSARYTRPVDALDVLWRFSREQLDTGASRVHSIGELTFSGGPDDRDWHWYEGACNEVLVGVPLTATCLYGSRRCPASAVAMAHATHHHVAPSDHAPAPADELTPPRSLVPSTIPERTPDAELLGLDESRPVRELLRGAASLDDDVVGRASVVFSELVTNAVRHGGGAADLQLWFDDGAVVGRVDDDGAGITDPFATVRLPRLAEHGVGLWLANVESSRLVVERRAPSGTTAVALVAPR